MQHLIFFLFFFVTQSEGGQALGGVATSKQFVHVTVVKVGFLQTAWLGSDLHFKPFCDSLMYGPNRTDCLIYRVISIAPTSGHQGPLSWRLTSQHVTHLCGFPAAEPTLSEAPAAG